MTTIPPCPRCTGPLFDQLAGADIVASSLAEPAMVICMDCAADEAQRLLYSDTVVGKSDWPMGDDAHDYLTTFELDPDSKPSL